jgi:hypothetical protein
VLVNRNYPSAINFGCHRTPQERHGQHDPIDSFEIYQDSLDAAKSAMLNSYSLADLQVWPRLTGKPRIHQSANSSDFVLVDGDWDIGYADNGNHRRCLQYGQSILGFEPAKEVSGK